MGLNTMFGNRWEPDNSLSGWLFNESYGDYGDPNYKGLVKGHSYTKYNDSRYSGEGIDHLMWDKDTGDIFYKNPESNIYVKANKNANTSWGYASDADLTAAYDDIASLLQNAKISLKIQAQKTLASSVPTPAQEMAKHPVTPSATPAVDAEAQANFDKRQSEANAQLLTLLSANQPVDTPTEDPTTYYKYGSNDIDLEYYLHNAGTNLSSYLDSRKNWSLAQKDAFMKSYDAYKSGLLEQLETKGNRFFTDDAGYLNDNNGVLAGENDRFYIDKDGNTYASLDDIKDKKLKKSAVLFSPNDEVAKYFKTIGRAIVNAGKTRQKDEESEGDFDFNKHGFVNHWVTKINPAGGQTDIDPYLNLDPVGLDGKRARTNRTKYLINELTNYRNTIANGKLKFDKSNFKNKETYLGAIDDAIANLSNGWDNTDAASLQRIGIRPDFYQQLMSDAENPLATDAELSAKEAERKQLLYEADAEAHIQNMYDHYLKYANAQHTFTKGTNEQAYIPDTRFTLDSESSILAIGAELKSLGFEGIEDRTLFNLVGDSIIESTLDSLRGGRLEVSIIGNKNIPLSKMLPIIVPLLKIKGMLKTSVSDPTLLYVDMPEKDAQTYAVLCIQNGKIFYDFIGNVPECTAFLNIGANFDKDYTTNIAGKPKRKWTFHKEGGILKFLDGGEISEETEETEEINPNLLLTIQQPLQNPELHSLDDLWYALYGKRQEQAAAKGMSYDQYNKKQRKLNGVPDLYNEDNGQWKTEDYMRLGAIAADITSLVLDPVSGAVANVGSTATNFLADWADDSVTTGEMWKNLGMNLGMDALSIVPIVGDAAGTGGKLLKSVKTFAPKIMYGLTAWGVLGTLKNGNNIMESLGKVMSDEKLTVGDWQNIAQAITAVAGVNGAVKSGVSKKIATKRAKVDDAIGLGVKNNKTGKVEDIIIRGEQNVKGLREAIAKNDTTAVNDALHKLHGFDHYEINTNVDSMIPEVSLPWKKNAQGERELASPFNVSRKIDSFEIFDKSKLRPGLSENYTAQNWLNLNRQAAVEQAGLDFSADRLLTKEAHQAFLDEHFANEAKAALKATTERQAEIDLVEDQRLGTKKEDGTREDNGLEAKYNKAKELEAAYEKQKKEAVNLKTSIKNARLKKAKELGIDQKDVTDSLESLLNDLNGDRSNPKSIKYLETEVELLKQQYDVAVQRDAPDSPLVNEARTKYTDALGELDSRKTKQQELQEWTSKYGTNALDSAASLYSDASKALKDGSAFKKELAAYDTDLTKVRNRLQILQDTTRKSKRTRDFLNTINSRTDATGTYRYVDPATNREYVIKDVKNMINNLHLMRKGGRLQFLLPGGNISGVGQHNELGDWTSTVGELTWAEILKRLEKDPNYYKTINKAQDEHSEIRTAAKGNWDTQRAYYDPNGKVRTYQTNYLGGNWNDIAIQPNYESRYDFSAGNPRNSGDRYNTWTPDNLYAGITDDRRLLGRDDDYSAEMVTAKNKELAKWGLQLDLSNLDKYWRIKPLQGTPQEQEPNPSNPSNPENADNSAGPGDPKSKAGYDISNPNANDNEAVTPSNIIGNLLGKLKQNSPELLETARLAYLNNSARAIANHAKKGELPYLQDPVEHHRQVYGNWRAVQEGEKANASLTSIASRPLTSDGSLQTAAQLEARMKGQQYIDAGAKADDEMIRKTSEASWQQEKENKSLAHNIAMQNRLSMVKTAKNRHDIDNALKSEITNNVNTAWQGWIHDIRAKAQERELMQNSAVTKDIDLAVSQNPNQFGANLSDDEEAAYNRAMAGESPSEMRTSDVNAYNALVMAMKKVNLAKQQLLRRHYNIPDNPWSLYATYTQTNPENSFVEHLSDVPRHKDGSKLEISRLRKKAKNADRVQKSIHKLLDSLDKKLDRISKSMYGYPKSEVIKSK